MLVANAVVDTDQPRLQVGAMDDRQVLLGNALDHHTRQPKCSYRAYRGQHAAPIVAITIPARVLDEPTERLGATVEPGEPKASGIAARWALERSGLIL